MIRAENLGKKFDRRWVLRHVSFELEQGDALVVLGQNGSGKSTLLRMAAGLLAPSEGSVVLPEPPNVAIGYFSLDGRVYPSLTVREHLAMSAELRGIACNADEWIERIGLGSASDRFGGQLSTGMRSRLKLALAAHHSPQLLILDEPGAGIDEQGRVVIEEICACQVQRGALIVATNDTAERRFGNLELQI